MTARGHGAGPFRVRAAGKALAVTARRAWEARHHATPRWAALNVLVFVAFGHAGLIAGLILWATHLRWDPAPAVVGVGAAASLAVAGLTWLMAGVPELGDVYLVTQRDVPSLLAVIGVVGLATAAWRGATAAGSPALDEPVARIGSFVRSLATAVRRPHRLPEIALLRSVALVVVVGVHALPDGTASTSGLSEQWITDAAFFAVPALVFAAGQLAARNPLPRGGIRRRLEGLLGPYLALSVVAIGLRTWSDAFPPIESPAADLLVGATFSPYHLVLTLVLMTVATPVLLRLRGAMASGALVIAVVAQAAVQVWGGPFFWRLRNPLLWLAFYLAGILAWRHRDRLGRWTGAWPGLFLFWSIATAAVLVVPEHTARRDLVTLGAAWLMVATLWLAGRSVKRLPRAGWGIGRVAYLLYLAHVPFVIVVTGPAGAPVPSLRAAAGWIIGLIGALSVIVIRRRSSSPIAD